MEEAGITPLDEEKKEVTEEEQEEITPEDPPEEEKKEEEEYSARVQKRIDRLVWERNREREERERLEREKKELEERYSKQLTDTTTEALKQKIDQIKGRMKSAYDDGELGEIVDLQDQLAEARAELKFAEQPARAEPRTETRTETQAEQEEYHPATEAWLTKNDWFGKDRNATKLAQLVESQLLEEGYELGPDLYRELDSRIGSLRRNGEKLPNKRAPVAGQARGNEGTQNPGKKLTQADLGVMRKYGLDPNSPADRKAWLNRNNPL